MTCREAARLRRHSSASDTADLAAIDETVTFDAYATLINFELGPTTLKVIEDRLDLDNLEVDEFLDDFRNTDDNLIARNVENIGVEFDHVITAQQAGAYKPDRQTFEHAFKTIGVEPSQVIHTPQGWEYDHIPTRDLGLKRRVWINRYGRLSSADYQPCDELPDLSGLPTLLGC
jgi:FMN phosphatase YigB (HAD superfamily)